MRIDDRLEALAPHVEARWRQSFLTELSLPDQVRWEPAQALRTWTKVLLLIGGVWAVVSAGPPFLLGQRAEVSAGTVVSAAATIVPALPSPHLGAGGRG